MKLPGRISDLEPDTHEWLTEPPGGNILQVNLKAKYSPYVVVDPRIGSVHRLEGDDLVVWIGKDAAATLRITVAPAGAGPAR